MPAPMAELPAFKARPESVGPILDLIKKNEGNYRALVDEIARWWRTRSTRTEPPSTRNSLRAVFGPTLRHLQLIRGAGEQIIVSHLGDRLLAAQCEGEAAIKKEFAAQLIRHDRESWVDLLQYLESRGSPIAIQELVEYLRTSYPSEHVDQQKVSKYLNYFAYVGLIRLSSTEVNLRLKQFHAARDQAWAPLPSAAEFANAVDSAYSHLSRGSAYVPIPHVRDAVCGQFGIWDEDFDRMLIELPKETDLRIIQLTAPMARARGGLRIGGAYVYYMAVHRKAAPE